MGLLIHIHANSGIAHRQDQPFRTTAVEFDMNGPAFGELDGVGNHVVQDLQHAVRIAQPGDLPIPHHRNAEGQPLFRRLQSVDGFNPLRHVGRHERHGLDRHLVRLDLGHVQKIIDDAQQQGAGIVHDIDHAALILVADQLLQNLGNAQHAVQGGAHLVAHLGQEIRFGCIRALRLVQRLLARGLGRHLVRHVQQHVHDTGLRLLVPLHPRCMH